MRMMRLVGKILPTCARVQSPLCIAPKGLHHKLNDVGRQSFHVPSHQQLALPRELNHTWQSTGSSRQSLGHSTRAASSGSGQQGFGAETAGVELPSSGPASFDSARAGPSGSTQADESEYYGAPKLVIFGGNGFVGSAVCKEALSTGLSVVSVSRSGAPKVSKPWMDNVEWLKGDGLQPESYRKILSGAVGVITCIGAFGSNEQMLKVNGETNIKIIEEAAQAGVSRCVFISVHDFKLGAGWIGVPESVLHGYFQGKRNAEAALFQKFPEGGVALRPGFIHGTRQVGSVGIPLGAIGAPLEKVLSYFPTPKLSEIPLLGAAFVPPTSAQTVAKAAVAAATDPSVPSGVMNVWEIHNYAGAV